MIRPEPLSVRSEREGRGVHRLTPVGELDIATVPILEGAFDSAFADVTAAMVVVDLTELDFMDSTGIRLLLQVNDRFPERLRVINGSSAVERVLDVTGVRDRLPIISNDTDPLEPPKPLR
jgi:anti-sigma B factor antagonist